MCFLIFEYSSKHEICSARSHDQHDISTPFDRHEQRRNRASLGCICQLTPCLEKGAHILSTRRAHTDDDAFYSLNVGVVNCVR